MAKAEKEFEIYRKREIALYESDFDKKKTCFSHMLRFRNCAD